MGLIDVGSTTPVGDGVGDGDGVSVGPVGDGVGGGVGPVGDGEGVGDGDGVGEGLGVINVFVMVHEPAARVALHVPLELYPAGIGDSVAVQTALPLAPVTVKTAGVDSDAGADAGASVPSVQESVTVTGAALLSEKSLLTVNVACPVLVIVQFAGTPSIIATPLHGPWLAM